MKTHITNTVSQNPYSSYTSNLTYTNHQKTLAQASTKIKPIIDTRRKSQIKIVNNNKIELNQQPLQHVHKLFKNIVDGKYKSCLDNRVPDCYETGKKILKDRVKKNPAENYVKREHQRELLSQAQRIKNCKSLMQRKKDNTDPIVNPTYFMREGNQAKSVTIQTYKDTILKKNRPTSAIPKSNRPTVTHNQSSSPTPQMPTYTAYTNVPNLNPTSKKPRPSTANPNSTSASTYNNNNNKNKAESAIDDLPQCTFKSILDHIVKNKMWRDVDIKMLYVRLCHKYGEDRVEDIWDTLMDQLER